MIKTKVAFLEGRLLSIQSEQSEEPLLFWSCKQAKCEINKEATEDFNELKKKALEHFILLIRCSYTEGQLHYHCCWLPKNRPRTEM